MKNRRWPYYTVLTLFTTACLVGGFLAGGARARTQATNEILQKIHPIRQANNSYTFIDPLLAYTLPLANGQKDFQNLEKNITSLINEKKKSGKLSDFSFFFNESRGSRRLGINETAKYTPASLLKVVIMITYFKEAETQPTILDQKLLYTDVINNIATPTEFDSSSALALNTSYTVEDLIEKMIIDSDNGAKSLLLSAIDSERLDRAFTDLHLNSPLNESTDTPYTLSPRNYSLFFRVLYNATYLSPEMSEKALSILSQVTFKDGLVAGVPAAISIAHKFGENVTSDSSGAITGFELHDCGIVYHTQTPYFICIMTKGKDFDELKDIIKTVSGFVYDDVTKNSL